MISSVILRQWFSTWVRSKPHGIWWVSPRGSVEDTHTTQMICDDTPCWAVTSCSDDIMCFFFLIFEFMLTASRKKRKWSDEYVQYVSATSAWFADVKLILVQHRQNEGTLSLAYVCVKFEKIYFILTGGVQYFQQGFQPLL